MSQSVLERAADIAQKVSVTGFLMLICAVAGLVLGGIVGASLGAQDEWLNFCADDGSKRYIWDKTIRQEVCD